MEKYKEDTMQSLNEYLPDLMANFLLHAQVATGPFNARKVNFNDINEFIGAQLDFNIHFPSRGAWEDFVSKWKNSSNFYLAAEVSFAPEGPLGTSSTPRNGNQVSKHEEHDREEDDVLVDPLDAASNL
ncbi:hypothetical protein J1N35_043164 [Gossypium stocksii]|uniref:Uncharacterized protein n=1 Tax=Gossypium stocksii TaxID=47602 RepID=A0A9D3U702_9ROSI|nr:hypothetical protein J1N35_043164 [Gossypium stocksii]